MGKYERIEDAARNVADRFEDAVSEAADKLRQTADQLENYASKGGKKVERYSDELLDRLNRGVETLKSTRVEELGDRAKRSLESIDIDETARRAKGAINPGALLTLAVVLGVGYAATQLFKDSYRR